MDVGQARLPARVLIVDDHRTFADLLALALTDQPDFTCVGVVGTIAAAVDQVGRLLPDMVLLDIQLGQESGLDAARRIHSVRPTTVIVVVSAHREPDWVVRAAQAGANAFAPKSGSLAEMLGVLREARTTSRFIAPAVLGRVASAAAPSQWSPARLTGREQEVLRLMGQGMAPGAIARLLNISMYTCRGYVKAIHAKLGVRSQLEAVVKAQRLGLIGAADER
jgi:DNA-binding NarL/FixJ family response regulator